MSRSALRTWPVAVLVLAFAAAGWAHAQDAAPAGGTLLETGSLWRAYFVWGPELVRWDSGEVSCFREGKNRAVEKVAGRGELSAPPPAGWAGADFDDLAWAPTPGPIRHGSFRRDLAAVYLRGRFHIDDPAATGELTLTLGFRGGAAVYVNGVEVARSSLPAGGLTPATLAEPYPTDAYVGPDGGLIAVDAAGRSAAAADRVATRIREPGTVRIPAERLRKGTNVLAVEIHRSPTDAVLHTAKLPRMERGSTVEWSMCGFESLRLTGGPAAGGAATVLTWPGNPLVDSWDRQSGEDRGGVAPIPIAAARNGRFSGVLMLRSTAAIKGLKVAPGELAHAEGGAAIPASAVEVRCAVPGMIGPAGAAARQPAGARYLGVLADELPAEVALPEGADAVTVPVWLTVAVPADAAAGVYRGKVAVRTDGAEPLDVPVELSVAAWALPDPKDFACCANLIESPESVALQYGVKLWSEEHWRLLERTFSLMSGVGVKVVYIPLIAQSNQGNEFSMVRWIKSADGGWRHDFAVAERYLDLAIRHLGKVPVVCLYVWTPTMGGGGFATIIEKPKNDRPMYFTVLDAKTGEMSTEAGPDWGAPESVPFWRPVFEHMRKALADRGMADAMAVGLASDRVPSKQALADLAAVAPEARWVIHAHGRYTTFAGKPLALDASVWGVGQPLLSTQPRYQPGWRNKILSTVFPRYGAGAMGHVTYTSPIGVYHAAVESYQAAGYNGLGRVGADFWPVVAGTRGRTTVLSRFPSWQRPGAPTMGHGALLFPGPRHAVATVRFEALRLGIQEVEARIFIEKALYDPTMKEKLGAELAARARGLLDERIEQVFRAKETGSPMYSTATDASWLGYAGEASERTARLFATAAEVARATGAEK